MFNKKSTRKITLIALAIAILSVIIFAVILPKVSAHTNDSTAAVSNTIETTAATTEAIDPIVEETQTTAESVETLVYRNNEAETQPATTRPTEPATQPTEPATRPTQPVETVPETEPATQPTEPATRPTEPATQPTEPETQPETEPETEPETIPAPTQHVHKYTVSNVVKATCSTSGYTTYVCACGHAYNGDTVAPVSHEYVVTVIDPTVESECYTLHTCKSCGDTKITDKTDKLPAPVVVPEVQPEATPEHHHAEIRQGDVVYVFCTDVTVPYVEPGFVYYPWSYYPF